MQSEIRIPPSVLCLSFVDFFPCAHPVLGQVSKTPWRQPRSRWRLNKAPLCVWEAPWEAWTQGVMETPWACDPLKPYLCQWPQRGGSCGQSWNKNRILHGQRWGGERGHEGANWSTGWRPENEAAVVPRDSGRKELGQASRLKMTARWIRVLSSGLWEGFRMCAAVTSSTDRSCRVRRQSGDWPWEARWLLVLLPPAEICLRCPSHYALGQETD